MPHMQAFVGRLNTRFNKTNIKDVDAALLAPGPDKDVGNAAAKSTSGPGAIQATPEERGYVMSNFPAADLEELRRVLHWAVTQDPRVPVQFLWVPGPTFQVEFWNVAGMPATRTMPESEGGISVVLRGPSDAKVIEHHAPS